MSTRSIIVVTGENGHGNKSTCRLYKHSDGYPTANLGIIASALEKAVEMNETPNGLRVDSVVGKIIGEATDIYGMGAKIEHRSHTAFAPDDLGNQGDLEWIYVIDVDELSVNVYGGGFSGHVPQVAFEHGPVNPCNYIGQLIEEYRQQELTRIETAINDIEKTGFSVNAIKANQH